MTIPHSTGIDYDIINIYNNTSTLIPKLHCACVLRGTPSTLSLNQRCVIGDSTATAFSGVQNGGDYTILSNNTSTFIPDSNGIWTVPNNGVFEVHITCDLIKSSLSNVRSQIDTYMLPDGYTLNWSDHLRGSYNAVQTDNSTIMRVNSTVIVAANTNDKIFIKLQHLQRQGSSDNILLRTRVSTSTPDFCFVTIKEL